MIITKLIILMSLLFLEISKITWKLEGNQFGYYNGLVRIFLTKISIDICALRELDYYFLKTYFSIAVVHSFGSHILIRNCIFFFFKKMMFALQRRYFCHHWNQLFSMKPSFLLFSDSRNLVFLYEKDLWKKRFTVKRFSVGEKTRRIVPDHRKEISVWSQFKIYAFFNVSYGF